MAKPDGDMPDCQPTVANFVPNEPPPPSTSRLGDCERAIDSRLTEPPNDGEPTVDVPTPRCTWIDWSECARSGKSAKYTPMSSESASGTPSSVKLRRVGLMPRREMYEYPLPPDPASVYELIDDVVSPISSGRACQS